jgi:ABC-type glycerol-3-phosphate transport system permease component
VMPQSSAQPQAIYAGYPQPPVPIYLPRVQRNLQVLGILWCVLGVYRIASGLFAITFLRALSTHNFGNDGWVFGRHWGGGVSPLWLGNLWPIFITTAILMAALAIFAGYGLLQRRPWGRTVAIVAAILALLKIPFGTALAIYTLWVLAPSTSGMEYDAIADRT